METKKFRNQDTIPVLQGDRSSGGSVSSQNDSGDLLTGEEADQNLGDEEDADMEDEFSTGGEEMEDDDSIENTNDAGEMEDLDVEEDELTEGDEDLEDEDVEEDGDQV